MKMNKEEYTKFKKWLKNAEVITFSQPVYKLGDKVYQMQIFNTLGSEDLDYHISVLIRSIIYGREHYNKDFGVYSFSGLLERGVKYDDILKGKLIIYKYKKHFLYQGRKSISSDFNFDFKRRYKNV